MIYKESIGRLQRFAQQDQDFSNDPGPHRFEHFEAPTDMGPFRTDLTNIETTGYGWYENQQGEGGIEIRYTGSLASDTPGAWQAWLWDHDPGIYSENELMGSGPTQPGPQQEPIQIAESASIGRLFDTLMMTEQVAGDFR